MYKRITAVSALIILLVVGIRHAMKDDAGSVAAPPVARPAPSPARHASMPPGQVMAAWLEDYRAASPAARSQMTADGVQIAKQRRAWLLELIRNDPAAALAAAYSAADLAALPPEIAALAEQRIEGTAFYGVLAICNHGPENPHGEGCRIEREVRLGGLADPKRYLVHTYGAGLDRQTEENGHVTGIAIDDQMAVAPPAPGPSSH